MIQVDTSLPLKPTASDDASSKLQSAQVPSNYFGYLPVRLGIVFGIFGAILIMALIAVLSLGSDEDIWQSPRMIASALLGENAAVGVFPILLGTVIHLLSGAAYGALFAAVMPRLPRPFWIVAGLLFGIAIWFLAVIGLPLVVEPVAMDEVTYFNILLITHLAFGLNLGAAGGLFGLKGARQAS